MATREIALQAVRRRIYEACMAAGRDPAGVRLLAVSKTFPAEAVREAAAAGQTSFGENYAQEAVDKIARLQDLALDWHFIGPIQSNKTRLIAEHFSWVHSVDRLKIAERLSEQRPGHLSPLKVLLQVNVSGEASKAGCAPDEVEALARSISGLPRLELCGLMAIPEPSDDSAVQRSRFGQLRRLGERLRTQGYPITELSMGMSADLESAVHEGATVVRIGTAIFGQRHYAQ